MARNGSIWPSVNIPIRGHKCLLAVVPREVKREIASLCEGWKPDILRHHIVQEPMEHQIQGWTVPKVLNVPPFAPISEDDYRPHGTAIPPHRENEAHERQRD